MYTLMVEPLTEYCEKLDPNKRKKDKEQGKNQVLGSPLLL
jgi:hypothetical protein